MIENPWIIVELVLYLGGMMAIGAYFARREMSQADYHMGGKKLPGWILALSERSTGESAWLILGLPGFAYSAGLSAVWIAVGLALLLSKKYRKYGVCLLGALVASLGVFALLKGAALYFVFAGFVAFSAVQMFLDKKPAASRQLPGTAGQLAAGGVIGFLSGLVGAGGGFVSVPFMTWCNVAIHNAVATSAALGFPIALSNVAGYIVAGQGLLGLPPYSFGYLWLPALVVIASCSVLMAPVGAKAAHALPVKKLKRAFAGVLFVLALYMLNKGIGALAA